MMERESSNNTKEKVNIYTNINKPQLKHMDKRLCLNGCGWSYPNKSINKRCWRSHFLQNSISVFDWICSQLNCIMIPWMMRTLDGNMLLQSMVINNELFTETIKKRVIYRVCFIPQATYKWSVQTEFFSFFFFLKKKKYYKLQLCK